MRSLFDHPFVGHLLTVGGVLLALIAFARLLSEKKQPANTLAWLLAIVLIPYVGVPLYMLLVGRKLRRLVATKLRVPSVTPVVRFPAPGAATSPTAQTVNANGNCPPIGGNGLQLITDGQDAYAQLERQILAAKHSIHITTFILGRDDTGVRLVKLLAERARAA